jgi:hypothetical protein
MKPCPVVVNSAVVGEVAPRIAILGMPTPVFVPAIGPAKSWGWL